MPVAPWSSSPCLEQGARLLPATHGVLLGPVVPGAAGVRHGAVPAGVHVIVVVAGGEGGGEGVWGGGGGEGRGPHKARRPFCPGARRPIRPDAAPPPAPCRT